MGHINETDLSKAHPITIPLKPNITSNKNKRVIRKTTPAPNTKKTASKTKVSNVAIEIKKKNSVKLYNLIDKRLETKMNKIENIDRFRCLRKELYNEIWKSIKLNKKYNGGCLIYIYIINNTKYFYICLL